MSFHQQRPPCVSNWPDLVRTLTVSTSGYWTGRWAYLKSMSKRGAALPVAAASDHCALAARAAVVAKSIIAMWLKGPSSSPEDKFNSGAADAPLVVHWCLAVAAQRALLRALSARAPCMIES